MLLLLAENPGKGDLRRRCVLALADVGEQIDQRLIRLSRLGRKPREDRAEVGAVEGRVLVDLPSQEALAKRALRHEANTELFEGRQYFLFRLSRPE